MLPEQCRVRREPVAGARTAPLDVHLVKHRSHAQGAQPHGWHIHRQPFEPVFVPFVLTDEYGKRTFATALTVAVKTWPW